MHACSAFIASGLEVINIFSCSTQLSMKFILLINVKNVQMSMSRINELLW